jgi:chitin-binding protein
VSNWRLQWTWPSGQSLTQAWGGRATTSGSGVTVSPESYNSSIPANGSVEVGFLGSGSNVTSLSVTCTTS